MSEAGGAAGWRKNPPLEIVSQIAGSATRKREEANRPMRIRVIGTVRTGKNLPYELPSNITQNVNLNDTNQIYINGVRFYKQPPPP
jgi:hypothetical protein